MSAQQHPSAATVTRHSPIALFDSGVGGLSVLRHVRELLPAESLIYLADNAHTPYGDKGEAFVSERVLAIGHFLQEQGAKALVVACNTATAAAVERLREALSIPIIGMEPGIKPAVEQSRSGRIGILATAGTVSSQRFGTLLERYGREKELHIQACPGLVERVEELALEDAETEALLERYLAPLREQGIDTLALGCTHYPFLIPLIRRLLGDTVTLIDTGPPVARQLQRILAQHDLLRETDGVPGATRCYASRPDQALRRQLERLWGEALEVLAMP